MATVNFYAGLRLSELAALDMADVEIPLRTGRGRPRAYEVGRETASQETAQATVDCCRENGGSQLGSARSYRF